MVWFFLFVQSICLFNFFFIRKILIADLFFSTKPPNCYNFFSNNNNDLWLTSKSLLKLIMKRPKKAESIFKKSLEPFLRKPPKTLSSGHFLYFQWQFSPNWRPYSMNVWISVKISARSYPSFRYLDYRRTDKPTSKSWLVCQIKHVLKVK